MAQDHCTLAFHQTDGQTDGRTRLW